MTFLSPAARWLAAAALLVPWSGARAQWQASLGLQERLYPGSLPAPGAARHEPVFFAALGRDWRWRAGKQRAAAHGSLRAGSSGDQGLLLDVDELHWELGRDRWTLRAGVSEVFWGVLDSQHLVDIVNQRAPDLGPGGDIKLGQPMVELSARGLGGTLDFYFLPLFRPRPLGGRAGRLWSPFSVAVHDRIYRSTARAWHPDWAARLARAMGPCDVGLSFFSGTNRDPGFEQRGEPVGTTLIPRYDLVRRVSLDLQWTRGFWLGKLEAFVADLAGRSYTALGGGIEFAPRDYLGLFAEYLFDSRGPAATTSFEHDLMLGARLLHRDGEASVWTSIDRVSGNADVALDLTRRLSNVLSLAFGGRAFLGDGGREPPLARRLDTSLMLGVSRYF